jgi:hypothetical protein
MPSRIMVPGASIARISRRRASSTGSTMVPSPVRPGALLGLCLVTLPDPCAAVLQRLSAA